MVVRQKLVQWWVEETYGGREAFQFSENADEISPLIRQQFRECGFAVVDLFGENHLTHGVDAIALEEHMFRPAETDAGGAESDSIRSLLGSIGVGTHGHARDLVAPIHELLEHLECAALVRL